MTKHLLVLLQYQQQLMKILNQFRQGFIQRIFHIKIQGTIDHKLAQQIATGLQKSWPYRPTALLVTINSAGGSILQAKTISDLLKLYRNRCNVPIVTFVEDVCLGNANLLLTTGVKCYSSSFSMIGDMGCSWSQLWFHRFAEKYNIKQEYISAGQNTVKFNPLQDIEPESEKWLKGYMNEAEYDLKLAITNNRSQHFIKNNVNKQSLEEEIFKAGIINSEKALKIGLIDGIRNLDQQLKQRYEGMKIKVINKNSNDWKKKLIEAL